MPDRIGRATRFARTLLKRSRAPFIKFLRTGLPSIFLLVLILLLSTLSKNMATPNWGMLQKSQSDPSTIEQAIGALISAHNADPEAHLGAGGSLQSHKAADIIDHLAASIIADKLASGAVTRPKLLSYQSWNLPFESVAGYSKQTDGNSAIEALVQALRITVGSVSGNISCLWLGEIYNIVPVTSKNPSISFSMKLGDPEFYDTYVVWGAGGPFVPLNGPYFGIKVRHSASTKIFGVYLASGGSEVETELIGVNPADPHFYRAELADGGATLNFYVDGVLSASVSPGWTTWDSDYLFSIFVKSQTNGENPPAFFWNFQVQQDI